MACITSAQQSLWVNALNMKTHLLLCLTLLALGGCATQPQDCDSRNADTSLLTKASCDYSGGYSEQVRRKEQELIDARAENELFRQIYDQISAEQKEVSQNLALQQQKQKELDDSMGKLLNQLKTRHANKSSVQQQIASLEQQLQASGNAAPNNDDPAVLAERQQQLRELQQKVSRLQLSLGYE